MKKLHSLIRKFKKRRMIAASAAVIGAILILLTKQSLQKGDGAKNGSDYLGDFFTNSTGIWNPMITFFGGTVHEDASKYSTTLSILFAIGIALVILGLFDLFWHRKNK